MNLAFLVIILFYTLTLTTRNIDIGQKLLIKLSQLKKVIGGMFRAVSFLFKI